MNDIHNSFAQQGLIRPRDGRVFAGVCAGLGRRFGLDPWPARLLFVLVLMVIPGSQILIYPILWILMPAEESLYPSYPAYQGYPTQPPAQGAPGYQGYPTQPPAQAAPGYQGYPTQPPAQAAAPQAEPQPPVEEPAASQQGDTA